MILPAALVTQFISSSFLPADLKNNRIVGIRTGRCGNIRIVEPWELGIVHHRKDFWEKTIQCMYAYFTLHTVFGEDYLIANFMADSTVSFLALFITNPIEDTYP